MSQVGAGGRSNGRGGGGPKDSQARDLYMRPRNGASGGRRDRRENSNGCTERGFGDGMRRNVDGNVRNIGQFQTDAQISAGRRTGGASRALKPWQPDGDSGFPLVSLDDEHKGERSADGGWNQFQLNKEKFGVSSTYNEEIYTTVLDVRSIPQHVKDTASRIAMEIDGRANYSSKEQVLEGENDNEETMFSAVQGTGKYQENQNSRSGDGVLAEPHLAEHGKREKWAFSGRSPNQHARTAWASRGTREHCDERSEAANWAKNSERSAVDKPNDAPTGDTDESSGSNSAATLQLQKMRSIISSSSPLKSKELRVINALNLEPAVPRFGEAVQRQWINFKQTRVGENNHRTPARDRTVEKTQFLNDSKAFSQLLGKSKGESNRGSGQSSEPCTRSDTNWAYQSRTVRQGFGNSLPGSATQLESNSGTKKGFQFNPNANAFTPSMGPAAVPIRDLSSPAVVADGSGAQVAVDGVILGVKGLNEQPQPLQLPGTFSTGGRQNSVDQSVVNDSNLDVHRPDMEFNRLQPSPYNNVIQIGMPPFVSGMQQHVEPFGFKGGAFGVNGGGSRVVSGSNRMNASPPSARKPRLFCDWEESCLVAAKSEKIEQSIPQWEPTCDMSFMWICGDTSTYFAPNIDGVALNSFAYPSHPPTIASSMYGFPQPVLLPHHAFGTGLDGGPTMPFPFVSPNYFNHTSQPYSHLQVATGEPQQHQNGGADNTVDVSSTTQQPQIHVAVSRSPLGTGVSGSTPSGSAISHQSLQQGGSALRSIAPPAMHHASGVASHLPGGGTTVGPEFSASGLLHGPHISVHGALINPSQQAGIRVGEIQTEAPGISGSLLIGEGGATSGVGTTLLHGMNALSLRQNPFPHEAIAAAGGPAPPLMAPPPGNGIPTTAAWSGDGPSASAHSTNNSAPTTVTPTMSTGGK